RGKSVPEDKAIKSGQLTLPRVVFLAACGGILFVIVAYGWLNIGHLLLTAVLCGLLLLIAMDYAVNMEKEGVSGARAQAAAGDVAGLGSDKRAPPGVRVDPARRRLGGPATRRG